MKSVIKKIIVALILLLIIATIINRNTYAQTVSGLLNSGELQRVQEGDSTGGGIKDALNTILGIVQIAGTGIAVIMISLTGIRYMMASVDEKAQAKKYLIGAAIGSLLLFGGIGIMKIIQSVTSEAFGTP